MQRQRRRQLVFHFSLSFIWQTSRNAGRQMSQDSPLLTLSPFCVFFAFFFCLAVQVNAIPGLQCSQFSGHRKPQTVSKWSCQNVCSMLACCMQPVRTSTLGWTAFIIHPFLGMGVTWSPGWKRQCENCFVCGIKTSSSGPELSSSPRAAGRFSDGRGFRPADALITSGSCHMQINQNPGVFQI